MKLNARLFDLMIQKLKTLIKLIAFCAINIFVKSSKEVTKKTLLIIRLDAIGDYILFRNYIEALKKIERYKNYKITLIGNSIWKDLALELDSQFVDGFIWLDKGKFDKNLIYRYKKLREIASVGYEIVVNPVYSREFYYGDMIVKLVNASEKVGSIGDLSNIKKWQKKRSDTYYTQLIDADSRLMFEFNRNKEFFENFLQQQLIIPKPFIKLNNKKLSFELPENYALLFIGASASFRKWDIEKFAQVAKYLKNNLGLNIVLCGGSSDKSDADIFKQHYTDDYLDLVGKMSLVDFLYVIYNGKLMIANETSAPHFAVALEMTKLFVISNGNHYGRFTPYPTKITSNYHVIYHPEIEKDLDDYKKLSNLYGLGSELNISDISVERVIETINAVY